MPKGSYLEGIQFNSQPEIWLISLGFPHFSVVLLDESWHNSLKLPRTTSSLHIMIIFSFNAL
jgi:hypothetical protein